MSKKLHPKVCQVSFMLLHLSFRFEIVFFPITYNFLHFICRILFFCSLWVFFRLQFILGLLGNENIFRFLLLSVCCRCCCCNLVVSLIYWINLWTSVEIVNVNISSMAYSQPFLFSFSLFYSFHSCFFDSQYVHTITVG